MKNSILFGIIGLLLGVIVSGAVASYAVNNNNSNVKQLYGMNHASTSESTMSMADMTSTLIGKSGDDFDKTFISEMVAHHQGAITMAQLAGAQAKHQEVKDLAKNIITAQTTEIQQMKDWQTQWGYTSNSTMNGHSMMGM